MYSLILVIMSLYHTEIWHLGVNNNASLMATLQACSAEQVGLVTRGWGQHLLTHDTGLEPGGVPAYSQDQSGPLQVRDSDTGQGSLLGVFLAFHCVFMA